MTDQTILCPKCGEPIPLNQALSDQARHQLQHELESQFQEKLDTQLKAKLEAEKQKLDSQLQTEKQKLWQTAQDKAREKIDTEMKDLQEQFKEKSQKLEAAQNQELELRKKTRELEEAQRNLNLEMQRKLDEERKKLVEDARKAEAEEQHLKFKEKDKQIEIMQKTIEDLRRQSQQGSMQIQGDVQEDELKQLLGSTFYTDTISDVATGVKGADLIQTVNTPMGQKAGVILWESKNTKVWKEEWIAKLKQDQGKAGADVCLIVTKVLPADVKGFGVRNGIWVLEYQYAVPLVTALRLHMLEISKLKNSMVGRDQKMENLYAYLTGSQFKNRVESIVTAFTSMQKDLEAERRAMEKIWSKRQVQLDNVIRNSTGLYGDLEGIAGVNLPAIQALELPTGDGENTSEEISLF